MKCLIFTKRVCLIFCPTFPPLRLLRMQENVRSMSVSRNYVMFMNLFLLFWIWRVEHCSWSCSLPQKGIKTHICLRGSCIKITNLSKKGCQTFLWRQIDNSICPTKMLTVQIWNAYKLNNLKVKIYNTKKYFDTNTFYYFYIVDEYVE